MHWYPRRRNVAAQVVEEYKNGHIHYPSYGGTQKGKKSNRLKRISFNHISKHLHRCHEDLPTSEAEMEMLVDFEESDHFLETVSIVAEAPGIQKKDCQAPHQLKALALEKIEDKYNPRQWTHVFIDGSSEGEMKNGGGGIFIRHTDGIETDPKSLFRPGRPPLTTELNQQPCSMQ